MLEGAAELFDKGQKTKEKHDAKVEGLYRQIGQLKVENDFFIKRARSIGRGRRKGMINAKHPGLSLRCQCSLLVISR